MASESRGYWSRSWQLLTRDEGWIKPLLVLGAVRLVPIVGHFGADGYGLEWARLTAWGVDSSPKQKNVDTSACLKTGARAFVVSLGYLIVLGFARRLLVGILGDTLGGLLAAAVGVVGGAIIVVAKLHSAIYQSISAGYQVPRVAEMIKRDYRGLLRIAGMALLISLAITTAITVVLSGATLLRAGDILFDLVGYTGYGYDEDWFIVNTMLSLLGRMAPVLCLLIYAATVGSSFESLMVTTATGLWMRQFDVANWGEANEPLPQSGVAPASSSDGYGVTTVPTAAATHHAPAAEPAESAAAQEVPTPVETPAVQEVPAPVEEQVVPEIPLPVEEQVAEEQAPAEEPVEAPTQDDEMGPEPIAPVALADEPVAEVPTFALDEPVETVAVAEVAETADDVRHESADDLLAQASEAIHEVDLTAEAEQATEVQTIELDVPGESRDDGASALPGAGDRIVEVIDLSAGQDEQDTQDAQE